MSDAADTEVVKNAINRLAESMKVLSERIFKLTEAIEKRDSAVVDTAEHGGMA